MSVFRAWLTSIFLLSAFFACLASSSSAPSPRSPPSPPIPPFVSKDRDVLSEFLTAAAKRHADDVRKAKDAYPCSPRAGDDDDDDIDDEVLRRVRLDRHDISRARGALPDFADDLPKRVCVTSADTPLFSREEVKEVVDAANEHFRDTGGWKTLNSGQYPVAGFWIRDVPAVHRWFCDMTRRRLLPLLQREFPAFVGDSPHNLVVDNAYLFRYTPETGRRTDVHTDSGCLSFTIALNGKDEYRGGGTWFEGLGEGNDDDNQNESQDGLGIGAVVEMDAGQVTIRPGGVRHCGYALDDGVRYIIGGFCMHVQKVEYVRMLLAEGLELRGKADYARARRAWETAIVLNPSFDGPYSHLASLYNDCLRDPDMATKVLQHCYDHVNRDSGEIAYSLGVAKLERGDYGKAEECLRQCLNSDSLDADAMMALARVKAAQNDIAGEKGWYEKIITLPSKVADDALLAKAFCNLGVLSNEDPSQSIDDEIAFYRKSLELRPANNFAASYSLGCAFAVKEQYGDAVEAFRSAVDAASDDKPDERRSALSNLYRVVMSKLQEDYPNGPESRDAMMKQFVNMMGKENYEQLASAMGN